MSANLRTDKKDSLTFDWLADGAITKVVRFRTWGFVLKESESVQTSTIAVNVQGPRGLAALVGKYDNDPTWDDFNDFVAEYRRQMDEMN